MTVEIGGSTAVAGDGAVAATPPPAPATGRRAFTFSPRHDGVEHRPRWAACGTTCGAVWDRRWPLFFGACAAAVAVSYGFAGGELNIAITLTAFVVGLVFGTAGMGAASFMTPILIIFFGFQPSSAVGTIATYGAVTKSFGAWRHWRHRSVNKQLVFYLACGSVPMAIFGVSLVNYVKGLYGEAIEGPLLHLIGAALATAGVLFLLRAVMNLGHHADAASEVMSRRRKAMTVVLGLGAGFLVGLTSVGSGSMFGFFLMLFYPFATRRIVGSNVFHAAVLLVFTSLTQLSYGNVDLWVALALVLGSVPGVVLGSRLTVVVPERPLRAVLSVVLLLSGIGLFFET
jgi:hypothetical protein